MRTLLLIFFYIFCSACIGQSINISNTSLDTCSATIYDDGGINGDYSETDYTMTVCAQTGSDLYFVVNFLELGTAFSGDSDYFYIYEGSDTTGTLLFDSSNDGIGNIVSTTAGCITINIQTNPHFFDTEVAAGFELLISCTIPETCNDGILNNDEVLIDCGGPNCSPCFTQTICEPNVVNNGDFETPTTTCGELPDTGSGSANQIPRPWFDQTPVQGWIGTARRIDDNISYPSPDYNNGTCTNSSQISCMNGSGSLGFYTHFGGNQSAEYIQTQLNSALEAGEEYCISVRAVTARGGGATNKLGFWFHNNTYANGSGFIEYNDDNGGAPFMGTGSLVNAQPQVVNPVGQMITSSCQDFNYSFCANGGEEFLMVGNFTPGAADSGDNEYVAIDDLVIAKSCPVDFDLSINSNGTPDCAGSCVGLTAVVGNQSGGCEITNDFVFQWFLNGNPITGEISDTINVCPAMGEIYSVEVTYSAGCRSTTKSITYNSPCAPPTSIDFDGIDDYIATTSFIGGITTSSQMAWVRLNPSFGNLSGLMGQSNHKVLIESDRRISGSVTTTDGTFTVSSTATLENDVWAHVTSIYDGSFLKLYLNGEEVASIGATGNLVSSAGFYEIGRDPSNGNNYIHAFIDDVRVYNTALTLEQLQEQVYQEVAINGANIEGVVIPKIITGLPATALDVYYKMDPISLGKVIDQSSYGRDGTLYNITTVEEQNAPMPYVANNSGGWTNQDTWQFGAYWDIEDLPNKDWAIVQITNNTEVTTVNNHTHLGLIIDSGSSLIVGNDSGLFNTSYLRLDGMIDLQGESQLIQTLNSDLAVSSSGYIERDQQGKADIFSYNYWSSPVGAINSTSNNNPYTVSSILRDGTNPANPLNINFTTGYDGAPTSPITLSNFWIYTYQNQPDDYLNWTQLLETGNILPSQGYTMKGSGAGTTTNTQNYVFIGKPNNGEINSSLSHNNLSLLGNPYPSALDADQFILDNLSVINEDGDVINAGITTGALYFWEHFTTNNSHHLSEYEGGYATYNLTGATVAVPDPDVSSNGVGSTLPQRYIPVGQGFMVQGGEGGTVTFNNNQRAFEKESDGGSIFTFTGGSNTSNSSSNESTSEPRPDIDRLYFRVTLPSGVTRQLLLGVKSNTTLGLDYGYDAKMIELTTTDIAWDIDSTPYVIQTIGEITNDTELPLYLKSGDTGIMSISIEELQNITDDLPIYLLDKQTETYTDLRNMDGEMEISTGVDYSNRYYIVFDAPLLSTGDDITKGDSLIVYHDNNYIIINSDNACDITNIRLYNMIGQEVLHIKEKYLQTHEVLVPVKTLSEAAYIVQFDYNNHHKISRKVIKE